MAFKSILVPTDGSEYTKFAVKEAIDLAAAIDAKITAVYVLDRALFSNMPMDTAVLNVYTVLEKEGKEAVEYVKAEGKKKGVEVETKVVEGTPVKTIVEMSGDYDLVVMGTLGRTGFSKLMLGSVAEKVVRFSSSPVLVVGKPVEGRQ
ncbi:MAG: universal stress protein [Candidatus Methanomethylophilaceae archaeon]|nr:universal stress protein [Candidatus Methanomethylophilaceae archaeon]